jgi:hypothetical protein
MQPGEQAGRIERKRERERERERERKKRTVWLVEGCRTERVRRKQQNKVKKMRAELVQNGQRNTRALEESRWPSCGSLERGLFECYVSTLPVLYAKAVTCLLVPKSGKRRRNRTCSFFSPFASAHQFRGAPWSTCRERLGLHGRRLSTGKSYERSQRSRKQSGWAIMRHLRAYRQHPHGMQEIDWQLWPRPDIIGGVCCPPLP